MAYYLLVGKNIKPYILQLFQQFEYKCLAIIMKNYPC